MARRRKDLCDRIWPFSTYIIVLIVSYAVYALRTLKNTGPYYLLYVFIIIDILSIWSHIRAWTADPGYLPINKLQLDAKKLPYYVHLYFQQELERGELPVVYKHDLKSLSCPSICIDKNNVKGQRQLAKKIAGECFHCNSIKPPGAHHCKECNRCVARMDHHCPWIDNCLGIYTYKPVMLFLIYTFIASLIALIMIISDLVRIISMKVKAKEIGKVKVFSFLIGMLGIILAVFFLAFTGYCFKEQVDNIIEGGSLIDKKQGNAKASSSIMQNVRSKFGKNISLEWFIPTLIRDKLTMEGEYEMYDYTVKCVLLCKD